jgi:phenylalanyl-tRNA synthetase alpha chain
MSLLEQLKTVQAELEQTLDAACSVRELDEIKRAYLGKKSFVKQAFGQLRTVSSEERPTVAAALNQARAQFEGSIEAVRSTVAEREHQARVDAEWMDLSMPGLAPRRGMRHPVTQVENRCLEVLRQFGFELVDGPEVDNEFHNFDALNIPKHHPARDMQDTFWLDGGMLLRSHTTTVQARVLQEGRELPIRVASAGRVYRNEAVDATHLAMFHQLEGFWVDRGLTFGHLMGVLAAVVRSLYGESTRYRFKPKYYPYTEPSLGMDIACTACDGAGCSACHGAGWVTIIGAGMIHRKVLTLFGYDPDEVGGFAFGWGTTRMASQYAGVSKVRSLYEPDLRLLRALHRGRSN